MPDTKERMPRKGMRFFHARVLDTAKFDGKTPQLYQVTRVAQGQVYFAPVYDAGIAGSERLGKSERCRIDYFPRVLSKDSLVLNAFKKLVGCEEVQHAS